MTEAQEPAGSGFGRRTSDIGLFPGTGHLLFPFLCFHQHPRSHLHFLKSRRHKMEVSSQNDRGARASRFWLWTSDLGYRTFSLAPSFFQ
jgi:hypothetical protein